MTISLEADRFDQAATDFARDLAACKNTDDIVDLYASRYGAESYEVRNAAGGGAYPAAFGRAQAVLSDLLGIIERQRAELARLRPAVEMACNECGKTVIRNQVTLQWEHYDQTPDHGTDIVAGVAAGHPARA